ncbi:hypothetical protein B566_EDAN015805 [Ephemera danica]|nr:hypothetical protein B566_EDAN015805 [Ephemera danica]
MTIGDEQQVAPPNPNYWALLALALVVATAAGNILVCLAISWERRLQNVTNYFLMSLAITDLMVAVLVMPLGILTLVRVLQLSTSLRRVDVRYITAVAAIGIAKRCRQHPACLP